MDLTPEKFKEKMGYLPVDDDLERVNCSKVGRTGHQMCGWCFQCDKPRFICGHLLKDALDYTLLNEPTKLLQRLADTEAQLKEKQASYEVAMDEINELHKVLYAIGELPRFTPTSGNGPIRMTRRKDGVFIQHFSVHAIIKGSE